MTLNIDMVSIVFLYFKTKVEELVKGHLILSCYSFWSLAVTFQVYSYLHFLTMASVTIFYSYSI